MAASARAPLQLRLPDLRSPVVALEEDSPRCEERGGDVAPRRRSFGGDEVGFGASGASLLGANPFASALLEDSASRTRRSGDRRRASGRGLGGASLEDFLAGDGKSVRGFVDRHSARSGGPRSQMGGMLRAARPTQRQPIDDNTFVDAEIYEAMMRHGAEARKRSTHAVAYAGPTGTPYLKHHDADALRKAQAAEAEAAAEDVCVEPPTPVLPLRPPSTCATEAMEAMVDGFCAAEPVPVQVL